MEDVFTRPGHVDVWRSYIRAVKGKWTSGTGNAKIENANRRIFEVFWGTTVLETQDKSDLVNYRKRKREQERYSR